MPVWLRLFAIAGMRENAEASAAFCLATRRFAGDSGGSDPLVAHWLAVDPFSDAALGEPRYIVLEKSRQVEWSTAGNAIDHLLDIAYRRTKRVQFQLPTDERVVLSLHHIQDFALLRPLIEVLPRQSVRVVMRTPFMDELQWRAIAGYFTRNGLEPIVYDRVEELPWNEMEGSIFITAAESAVAVNHIFALQAQLAAKLRNCRTLSLQHGMWPGPIRNRIATFASDHVITWTSAEQRLLNEPAQRMLGAAVPIGMFAAGQELRLGSPRYTDQLFPTHPDALFARLGVDTSQYADTVLFATKRASGLWDRDRVDEDFKREMVELFEAHAQTLFLVRPHPANSALDFMDVRRPNVIFLDEACCVAADINLNRIIPSVDRVVTTVSTIAVDAAVSEKTVVIYDAGQKRIYEHLQPVAFNDVRRLLHDTDFLAAAERRTKLFRAVYADHVDDRFYVRFAELLAQPLSDTPLGAATATALCLATEVEAQYIQSRENERARDELAVRVARTEEALGLERIQLREAERIRDELGIRVAMTEETLARIGADAKEAVDAAAAANQSAHDAIQSQLKRIEALKRRSAHFEREVTDLRTRLSRLRESLSWRLTKPVRSIASAIQRRG